MYVGHEFGWTFGIEHDAIKYSIHVRYGMSDTTLDRDTDTVHER